VTLPSTGWSLVVLSCVLALVVNYLSTYLSNECTGLSYSLLTLAKTLCTVCIGMLTFSEHLSVETLFGSLVTLTLFAVYLIESNSPANTAGLDRAANATIQAAHQCSWSSIRKILAVGVVSTVFFFFICTTTIWRRQRNEKEGEKGRI